AASVRPNPTMGTTTLVRLVIPPRAAESLQRVVSALALEHKCHCLRAFAGAASDGHSLIIAPSLNHANVVLHRVDNTADHEQTRLSESGLTGLIQPVAMDTLHLVRYLRRHRQPRW